MSEPERSARRFVVDTNVFAAAIKPFSKPAKSRKGTKTLSLLLKLITSERIELVGNSRLVDEYERLSEELRSETSELILKQIMGKTSMLEIRDDSLARCEPYLPKGQSADLIHAATALQTDAVLITNDKDFGKIGRVRVIKVWSISEAIRRLL